jgi:hypothetical protein
MTLLEAVASGRRFRKVGSNADYIIPAAVPFEDLTSVFELEPEVVAITITSATLEAAWNASRPASGSVALATESPMYRRLLTMLTT